MIVGKIREIIQRLEITRNADVSTFLRDYFSKNTLSMEEIDDIFTFTKGGTDGGALLQRKQPTAYSVLECFFLSNIIGFFLDWGNDMVNKYRSFAAMSIFVNTRRTTIIPFEYGRYYLKEIIYSQYLSEYVKDSRYFSELKNFVKKYFSTIFHDAPLYSPVTFEPGKIFFQLIANGLRVHLRMLSNYLQNTKTPLLDDHKYFVGPINMYFDQKEVDHVFFHINGERKLIVEYLKDMDIKLDDKAKLLISLA